MIYHTYFCLNRNCKHEFTVVDQDHPPCPRCTGKKVQWIPRTTGVISGKTSSIDKTVKDLVQTYGDKNYNSPRAGLRAAPQVNPSVVPGRTRKFAPANAPGWALEIPTDGNGWLTGNAYCGPTGVTANVTHGQGVKTQLRKESPTPTGSVPKYEAAHRP